MQAGLKADKRTKRLYSVPEAAAYLDISPRKAWDLVWDGKLPYVPLGRLVKVDQADLDDYIERSKVRNGQDHT